MFNSVPVIIPSILAPVQLLELEQKLIETADYPCEVIKSCSLNSASINRNDGIHLAGNCEMIVMVDDDILPLNNDWLRILIETLSRPDVAMVSSQLYKADGVTPAYMTGLQDCDLLPKDVGITEVPTKRLLTACCAFKPNGCLFDETYVGSGFEDIDYCNQLAAKRPNDLFLICHDSHVIHYNEQRQQRGSNWTRNKNHYESKWGKVKY